MKKFICIIFMVAMIFTASAQTDKISFKAPTAYPEGITYDSVNDLFYVSSVHTGTIGKVTREGVYSELLKDSALKSSFGMKIFPARKRLWVCIADPHFSKYRDSSTYKKMSRVIAIDLATGKKSIDIDLGKLYEGKHFANDLTLDRQGNVYITDSYSPVIYKVDSAGKASVFASHDLFKAVSTGLNGIVWHPKGYLLVANNSNGSLLKVDLTNPRQVSKVKINQFFPGADGLLLDQQQQLVLVQNGGVNKIFQLTSNDDWQSAAVKAATATQDMYNFPSTATIEKNNVWVMNAKLSELKDSLKIFSDTFSIQKAKFRSVNEK